MRLKDIETPITGDILSSLTGEILAKTGSDISKYTNMVVSYQAARPGNDEILDIFIDDSSVKDGYVRLNNEPIPIEEVEDEHEESNDFKPSFWWNNRRYFMENFIRTHNNPWVISDFPEFIHAYEGNEYYRPLFIEIIGDSEVNIWESKE